MDVKFWKMNKKEKIQYFNVLMSAHSNRIPIAIKYLNLKLINSPSM